MLEQKIADILKKDIESLGCFIWGIEISGGCLLYTSDAADEL